MKSLWRGALNFGMVNIPVKLYPATQQSGLKLQLVDRKDSGKIRYKRINESTGEEVKSENVAKAYVVKNNNILPSAEISFQPPDESKEKDLREIDVIKDYREGDVIILSQSDIQKAEPEKNKLIEVNHFVEEKEINSIYYENSYYIEPEQHGEKAYALLREALKKSGKVGVAQFVMRNSASLAVIKPLDEILVLSRIRFAEEIRDRNSFKLPSKSLVKPNELKMALTLIEQYLDVFDINKYKDEYAASLSQTIRDRASGKEAKVRKMEHSESANLIKQLKASLAANRAS